MDREGVGLAEVEVDQEAGHNRGEVGQGVTGQAEVGQTDQGIRLEAVGDPLY